MSLLIVAGLNVVQMGKVRGVLEISVVEEHLDRVE